MISPDTISELSEEVRKLTISPDVASEFCRIVDSTKWIIESPKSCDKREDEQSISACALSSIGGLQCVIEELRDIIQLALRSASLVQGLCCVALFHALLQ